MNPQKKLSSLQDILKRQQSDFIGREEHISLFRKNLGLPLEDDSRYFVFNVWGQTGVGKSSLVRQFRKIAEDAKVVTAYIDGTQSNLPMVMGCLAEQLEQQGYKLGQFSKRYKYWQKQEELASDSAALQGFSTFLEPTVANSVRAATPMEYRASAYESVRLVQESVELLTPLFLKDICKIAEKSSGIALFFDTYERSEEFLDSWLRDILRGRYGEVPLNITIVIAGRRQLDKNHWAIYEGLIARLPVEPFTEDEAKQYLARKGITNSQIIDVILNLSLCLPVLVATLATEIPKDINQIGVRAATPMEYRAATPMEYRTSVVEYFLQSIEDPKRRQLILDAAIPRYLNKDILAQLTDEDELINWLTAMPFVEKQSDNWVYHDVVRAKILDYIPVTSSQWALHGKLADYYVQLNVEKQWSHNWQTYKLNWLYHRLCESPQKTLPIALNEFLSALNNRLTFAKQWAEIILQAGKDSDDDEVIHWGERLR
jgi:hypothetical protein